MKLLQVDSIEKAREKLLACTADKAVETEIVSLLDATGRILAQSVYSRENIPDFYRSTVDGYAVRAKDTGGASESLPVFLEVIEDVAMGQQAKTVLKPGTCAYVPTGGMLPEGADAMVMVEYSELFDEHHVALYASVAYGASVVVPGEDVKAGELLLSRGTCLAAPQIGALAAAGICQVTVYKPWTVTVISTGDELVAVEEQPTGGQVRDINGWTISVQAQSCGMKVAERELLKDDENVLKAAVRKAMESSDILLTSGGSSQGKKDMTSQILDEASDPGVFTHGLALKPGKPTILGYDRQSETLMVGLPGHPAAALLVFRLLIQWLWQEKTGQKPALCLEAKMETNIPGAPGKTTCQLVELVEEQGASGLVARPVFGRSGLITTMTKSHGYVMIGMNQEGLKKGETVRVYPF